MIHKGFIGSAWIKTSDLRAYNDVMTDEEGNDQVVSGGKGTEEGGLSLLISGGGLNPTQELNAPDNLLQGQLVKQVVNWGKVEVKGNLQAQMDENHKSIFDSAWFRRISDAVDAPDHMADESIMVKISYYRTRDTAANARLFRNLAINRYEMTVTAGEPVSFSVDFIGASQYDPTLNSGTGGVSPSLSTEHFNHPTPPTKLVTWDRCKFVLKSYPIGIQSFTFSVDNGIDPAYKVRSSTSVDQDKDPASTLYPVELVAKHRTLTGTVTAFAGDAGTGDTAVEGAPEEQFKPAGWQGASGDSFGAEHWGAYEADSLTKQVHVMVGEGLLDENDEPAPIIDKTFKAVFKRPEVSPTADTVVYTLNYEGVTYGDLSVIPTST